VIAGLVLMTAQAANVSVEFCAEADTNFADVAGGDYWTSNGPDRELPGVFLHVEDTLANVVLDGFTSDVDGCATLTLDDAKYYRVWTVSKAQTNGVDISVFDDVPTPALTVWVHWGVTGAAFDPSGSDGTEVLVVPATTRSAVLAVGTNMLEPTDWGLASGTDLDFFDDDCCNGGLRIQASTFSKTAIAHETVHGIAFRRDESSAPKFQYTAAEDGCDGAGVATDKHAQVTKEFQAAAAIEGIADAGSAWMWNDDSESDCEYDRHYNSDFDLDGVDDNANGILSCEAIPVAGLESYVTARDWLSDVVNADDDDVDSVQCTGTLDARGSQLDWLRYGWDMLQDEALSITDLLDIYDRANPNDWDPNGLDADTDDDVVVRWEEAADFVGFGAAHDDQKNNGQDH
jgi:hypothetical protein